jgi:prepilin-type N-terminal cleavage/methylation domain-containing protein
MKINRHKKAFSLIEISVVIVIVGILIAGISEGIDLYSDFKISKAKNLTTNSRVGRISDLNLWLETTADKSFLSAEKYNDSLISKWNSLNFISSIAISATQSAANIKPKYIANGLNGLPVVRFQGNDGDINNSDYMILPDEIIPYGDSEYSVFIVAKKTNNNNNTNIVLSGGSIGATSSTRSMNLFGFAGDSVINYWWPNGSTISSKTHSIMAPSYSIIANNFFYISEFFYDKKYNIEGHNRYIYINGSKVAEGYMGTRDSTKGNNFIGRRSDSSIRYFDGDLAELIVYERAISDSERKSVEEYLSQKWNIKIAN